MPKRQKILTPVERAEGGHTMAKYKHGTIYSGRASVRITDRDGTHIDSIALPEALNEKTFDTVLTKVWEYEDEKTGDFRQCRRLSKVEKVAARYRVLTAEIIQCPSFEVLEESEDDVQEEDD